MYAVLFNMPAWAKCSTSRASAPSNAAKLPVCLSSRSCSSIVMLPALSVNLPESIVHGETLLHIAKTPICLDAPISSTPRDFQ